MDAGVVVWVAGAHDETTARVAAALAERLARRHLPTQCLTLATPGIDVLDQDPRRVAFVASALIRHGVVVVVAVPSRSRALREELRATLGRFIEVSVGGDRPGYEAPERPEVQIDFPDTELDAAVERTMRTLQLLGYVPPADDPSYSAEEERQVIRRLKAFGYL
jgi:hypothetical protein